MRAGMTPLPANWAALDVYPIAGPSTRLRARGHDDNSIQWGVIDNIQILIAFVGLYAIEPV